ncbi:hypothetical protein TrVE_jg2718 [Triparma verrucosa]|uniref:C2H2-type domain-containing protein n=1 Tax=Triparma verrucosa TaxID=1606542 RepID=A0A9W7FKD3_9STRA|nr:hypothetical protein TrVE_jg2718 [Triparma verrucosa]
MRLFLAEGDFSYAATQSGPLVASGFDTFESVIKKYGSPVEARLAKMNSTKNVTVVHGVDATKTLHKGALPAEATAITEIEIRYPHTGIKSVASNRILLSGMITACTRLMVSPLCVDGCTLSISLKTTGRYNEWAGDIRSLARTENLLLLSVQRPKNPAGYEHVQTKPNQPSTVQLDQACTWVFQRKEFCSDPVEDLPDWLTKEVGERCEKCEVCEKIFSSAEDLTKHLDGKQHKRKLMAMNSAGGRRKEKRKREKAVKDEMKAQELEREDRPKSKKELRLERKKAKR